MRLIGIKRIEGKFKILKFRTEPNSWTALN